MFGILEKHLGPLADNIKNVFNYSGIKTAATVTDID